MRDRGRRLALLLLLAGIVAVCVSYVTVPASNTDLNHFDTIIVLGTPAMKDGSESPDQKARVDEAVREFRARRAGHIIMSGGAAWTPVAEALVMSRAAIAAGVPAEDVLIEGRSMNTVQNIFYSHEIMQQHGWTSAEVVSSDAHIRRAALILSCYRFRWRTHGCAWPSRHALYWRSVLYGYEALRVAGIRWFGFSRTPFLPTS